MDATHKREFHGGVYPKPIHLLTGSEFIIAFFVDKDFTYNMYLCVKQTIHIEMFLFYSNVFISGKKRHV